MLCSSLTYDQGLPHILGGEEIQQYTIVYTPPFDEFEVFKIDMPAAASTLVPASQVGATIFAAEAAEDCKLPEAFCSNTAVIIFECRNLQQHFKSFVEHVLLHD